MIDGIVTIAIGVILLFTGYLSIVAILPKRSEQSEIILLHLRYMYVVSLIMVVAGLVLIILGILL